MSGDEFARRFEVVAETRRRWSREEKLAIVKEASGPCVNISAVARRHGIKPALLYRWRKEFSGGGEPSVSLVPVVLEDRAPAQKPAPVSRSACGTIEITLANGRTIKVPVDLDAATLKRLLATIDV
ncbi:MAG: transposase [Alphaproteobacteria bacterium]|nr:transposase [Alphaproteobacteria bacterium]